MALRPFQPKQIALDIGGSSLVAIEVSGSADRLKLRGCWEWPLSEGLVVDGEIVDVDLFARELRAFANQAKLRGRSVQVAVSNQKVIVRNVEMPDMTEDELRGAIEFQAQDYIPIPVDEAVLDFQVVGKKDHRRGGIPSGGAAGRCPEGHDRHFPRSHQAGRAEGLGYRRIEPGACAGT